MRMVVVVEWKVVSRGRREGWGADNGRRFEEEEEGSAARGGR